MSSIFKQQYTTKDQNGKRIKKKSAYWYIDYKAAGGVRKRIKGFKDKTATVQLAAKLEREAELAQAGNMPNTARNPCQIILTNSRQASSIRAQQSSRQSRFIKGPRKLSVIAVSFCSIFIIT